MQDATRMHQQMDEMRVRAETHAAVAEDHLKIATERKALAQRELVKFQMLHEIFTLGQQVLTQRKQQFAQAEEPPTQAQLDGLEGAAGTVNDLLKQSSEAVMRHEGSFSAFSAFEQTLQQEAQQAAARARGVEAQTEKAVGVAEARNVSEAPQEASAGSNGQSRQVPGFLEDLETATQPEDSAKEPIEGP